MIIRLKTLKYLVLGLLFVGMPAFATTFIVPQGGTGQSSFTSSQLLYGAGTGPIQSVATSTLTATSPLTGSFTHVGTTGSLGCQTASGSQAGCLSAADWAIFNGKLGSYDAFTHPVAGTSATTSNFQITGASTTLQNFTFANATGTSATTTNFFATTASSTNLFSTNSNLGIVTSGLINGQTISSAANFTGSLTAAGKIRSTSPSSTGGLQVSPTGTNATIEILTDDSNHQPLLSIRSTGTTATQHIIAMDSNTGGGIISGGTQRALVLETTGPYDIILGYNSAIHTTFGASGGVTFTGALSGISTLNASGLGTFGNLLANASSTLQNFTAQNSTTTNATTTTFFATTASSTNLFSSSLKVDNTTLVVDSTNHRVGIGIASPLYKLQVRGTSNTVGVGVTLVNTADDVAYYGSGTAVGNLYLFSSDLNATGNVIGYLRNQSASGGSALNIGVTGAAAGDPYVNFGISGIQSWSAGVDNSDSDKFKIGPNDDPSTGTGSLVIDTSGNVGIGTTNPTAKLHVVDSTSVLKFNSSVGLQSHTTGTTGYNNFGTLDNAVPTAVFYNSSNTQIARVSATGQFYSSASAANNFLLNSGSSNFGQISNINSTTWSLGYGTSENTLGTNVLAWNSSGNVGIGVTAPSTVLTLKNTGLLGWDTGSGSSATTCLATSTTLANGLKVTDCTASPGTNQGIDQYLSGNIYVATATQSVNTSAETTLFSSTRVGTTTVPANFMTVGRHFYLHGRGQYSTPVGNVETVTGRVKFGGTTLATVTTAAFPASATNQPFKFDVDCTVRSKGASGTMACDGELSYQTVLSGTNVWVVNDLGTVGAITVDTTVKSSWDVTADWSATAFTTQAISITQAFIDLQN